jgi:nucleoside 2-deoxyribosyltransferase
MGMKTPGKSNKLRGQRVYLAGPIDHAEDDGVGWRKELTPWLESKGVTVLDPTDKKTSNTHYNEIGEEQLNLKKLRDMGRYHELREAMKPIVLADLRMVEVSDFVIVYLDPEIGMCGTWEELFISLRQHKPTLVVINGGKKAMNYWMFGRMNPDFIFENFEEMKTYLESIDTEVVKADPTRWVFLENDICECV